MVGQATLDRRRFGLVRGCLRLGLSDAAARRPWPARCEQVNRRVVDVTPERLVRTSKFLSLHLRHRPERLGLALEPGGWVSVDALLTAAARQGYPISRTELEEVVAGNDKQRFSFDASRTRVRANQGHSVPVDLALEAVEPPPVLYHGTGERSVPSIEHEGLRKMRRHHVHLSTDRDTARRVGARHGRPVVFEVDAAAMRADGYAFFRSANGVWLVEAVPARYLRRSCA